MRRCGPLYGPDNTLDVFWCIRSTTIISFWWKRRPYYIHRWHSFSTYLTKFSQSLRRIHITVTYKGDAHYIGENLNERKAGMRQLMLQYRSANANFVRFGFYNSRKSENYRFAIIVHHSRKIMDIKRALQHEGKNPCRTFQNNNKKETKWRLQR